MQKNTLLAKRFCFGIKKCTGKSFGRKVSFKKGGGVKRKFRLVNKWPEQLADGFALIRAFEHNPYTNTTLKLIQTFNNSFFYLAKEDADFIGKCIKFSKDELHLGMPILVKNLNKKFSIFQLKEAQKQKAGISRAAGTFCNLLTSTGTSFLLKLPSKRAKSINFEASGILGKADNSSYRFTRIKNAGCNRRKNIRPTVRGVAMNPIDHPHGGGEGKTSGGRPSVSPWGKLTKGKKTKKN